MDTTPTANRVDQSTMTDVEAQVVVADMQQDLPLHATFGEAQQSSTFRELMKKHVAPRVKALVAQRHAWREFCFHLGLSKPAEHDTRLAQATSNLAYYKGNYAVLGGGIVALGVGLGGWIILLFVALAWHTFFNLKLGDPSWRPVVLGMEVTADSRWRVLWCSTACLLLLMTWYILLPVGLFFFWHACLHKGPRTLPDIEETFQPATRQRALGDGVLDVEASTVQAEPEIDPMSGGSQAKQPFLETMS